MTAHESQSDDMHFTVQFPKEIEKQDTERYQGRKFASRRPQTRYCFDSLANVIIDTVATAVGSGSALIIQIYDPLHDYANQGTLSGVSQQSERLPAIAASLKWLWNQTASTLHYQTNQELSGSGPCHRVTSIILEALSDPPPLLFLFACIIFGFSLTALQYSHRKDKYQDTILSCGVIVGLATAWLLNEDFSMVAKAYLTWASILALLFSALAHWIVKLWNGLQIENQEVDVGEGEKS